MLETRAFVISVQGNVALVEAIGQGGCGHCSSEKGCGSGNLSQLFCTKHRQFNVLNEANAKAGEEVQITLPDGILLRSSILMYVLPLGFLLIGGILGSFLVNQGAKQDLFATLGSIIGLISGFILAGWISKRQTTMAVAKPVHSV